MEDLKVKKSWFVSSGAQIRDRYDLDTKPMGEGTFGRVVKGTAKGTKEVRAIKMIPKSKVKNPEKFAIEIDILKSLDHPNIIKLYETFEDNLYVYLVMELCEGGELFDRIIAKGKYSELEAQQLFISIMRSLHYCHKNKICHRDLKPENFLYKTKAADSAIKLIDFGLSKVFTNVEEVIDTNAYTVQFKGRRKTNMKTKAGTPYYIAPEVLTSNYDEKCDIWSAGVILYILLCGYPPFYGNNDSEILIAVKKGKIEFNGPEWKHVSEKAIDLIKKMVTVDAEVRLSAEQVLNHPFMSESHKPTATLDLDFNKLKNYVSSNKLQQAVVQFMVSQINDSEIHNLIQLFNTLDKNGDGSISLEEFRQGISQINPSTAAEIENVFKSLDADKSGSINYTEFISGTIGASIFLKEERLHQAFQKFDLNGDGFISKEEVKTILGKESNLNISEEIFEKLVKEADANGDGKIDYSEFMIMMQKLETLKQFVVIMQRKKHFLHDRIYHCCL